MEMLALLLVFPLLWPFAAKALFKHEYTLGELGLNIVIVVAIVSAGWYAGRYSQMVDEEVLNGQLVSKDTQKVSCEHSYQCNCREVCSGSGQNRSCSQTCDTCYEHSYDFDHNLRTTAGDLKVPRIDRQGSKIPPRWTAATIGDPVAISHDFENYIKAAPDSLFSAVAEQTVLAQFGAQVPAYPLGIFDLHYLNRVLATGVSVPDLADWNKDLAMRLRTLGPAKQVNWIVVITKEPSPLFAEALRVKWLGGKKNDVVVVLGAPAYPKLEWARVVSWTDQALFKVQLQDDLMDLPELTHAGVLNLVEKHTAATFKRKPMADFSYLLNEIVPPTWVIVLLALGGALGSVALSFVLARNNVRTSSYTPSYRRR